MLTCDEAEVFFSLNAKVFQDHFELVILTYCVLLSFVVLFFLFFTEWRQWEAGVTLEQVTEFLKLILKLLIWTIKTYVH